MRPPLVHRATPGAVRIDRPHLPRIAWVLLMRLRVDVRVSEAPYIQALVRQDGDKYDVLREIRGLELRHLVERDAPCASIVPTTSRG